MGDTSSGPARWLIGSAPIGFAEIVHASMIIQTYRWLVTLPLALPVVLAVHFVPTTPTDWLMLGTSLACAMGVFCVWSVVAFVPISFYWHLLLPLAIPWIGAVSTLAFLALEAHPLDAHAPSIAIVLLVTSALLSLCIVGLSRWAYYRSEW